MGKPAPEGIHQDGFDYVMVSCLSLKNVSGGDSILVDAKNHSQIIYDKALEETECLLFNDRAYAHYASPIIPKMPGICTRDVFVTTFQGA